VKGSKEAKAGNSGEKAAKKSHDGNNTEEGRQSKKGKKEKVRDFGLICSLCISPLLTCGDSNRNRNPRYSRKSVMVEMTERTWTMTVLR
jgi:hypothetical protein